MKKTRITCQAFQPFIHFGFYNQVKIVKHGNFDFFFFNGGQDLTINLVETSLSFKIKNCMLVFLFAI